MHAVFTLVHKLIKLHHMEPNAKPLTSISSRAHPGAPACTLTEVGCKGCITRTHTKGEFEKKGRGKEGSCCSGHTFTACLPTLGLRFVGFHPLCKHALDLCPLTVLIVCLCRPLLSIAHKVPVAAL